MDKYNLGTPNLCRRHKLAALELEIAQKLEARRAAASCCKSNSFKMRRYDEYEEFYSSQTCTQCANEKSDCKRFYRNSTELSHRLDSKRETCWNKHIYNADYLPCNQNNLFVECTTQEKFCRCNSSKDTQDDRCSTTVPSLRLSSSSENFMGLPSLGLTPSPSSLSERELLKSLPSLGLTSREQPGMELRSSSRQAMETQSRNEQLKKLPSLKLYSSVRATKRLTAKDPLKSISSKKKRSSGLRPPTPPAWDLSFEEDLSEHKIEAKPNQISSEDLIANKLMIRLYRRMHNLLKLNLQTKVELIEDLEKIRTKINESFQKCEKSDDN
ncbi:uncharacterized protein LOC133847268 [Drosophila sulfurigaster albostrigata]|uniref:uncharacterized protein LOC133847268 n=1 Tax=Drosophila sulfurigaster albostrigata TaxID=89887 RepID=UPI002D21B009|nr:uncharacterized protein LOC133847268 [Drosophila sulfurigaster albostrigata]